MYSNEQKDIALRIYHQTESVTETIRILGYPTRRNLYTWIVMYNEYCEDLSGDRNILFRMKELWSYLAPMFTNNKKYAKKIKKAEKCVVYENAVRELFSCEQLIGEVSYRCS